jgi:hypothetical protein
MPKGGVRIALKTVCEYRWGYLKVHREFTAPAGSAAVRSLSMFTVLAPSLSDHGYREGLTEQEGAPPFAFGSNRWGKLDVTTVGCAAENGLRAPLDV